MGEISDQIVDRFFENYSTSNRSKKKTFQSGSGNYKWKTKEGKIISMNDMSIEHLKRAISHASIRNNDGKLKQLIEVLNKKLDIYQK